DHVYGWRRGDVESVTPNPHRAIDVIRDEDMLADPEAAFGNLAKHLLLAPTKEQLKIAIERSSFERLREQEDAHGFREKPKSAEKFFREGRAGQWQEKLSRRQVRTIVSDHKKMMRKFSYLSGKLANLA